ncbi:hypothetical protein MJO28_002573 [Puccinia striiformis f. sp. tritici]|uniref:Uncharacterized protein n=1 Tax=Puccinia striiformis f. sp. tritici TaxID=168172 RepID=A0ACC0EQ72_9BASI|nr:hypothetical protein Pst134EA_005466 [Puccinia striiformis f. sp. tritici]KAI9618921.1 hypothetical protein H4Q26_012178 [Puccinia striiformis f. sp. tritici PST-130]KAH9462658.1 hypothetical protein Pst134EB_006542 [Puccinia striiformis f. sp. tritici]KAH9471575.1 hypothetical protein Pst134EA_005466 [Puccinia striiformis f. sp. tritici]KAI7958782.1 hypothetical protein MJO28_002573 [Puccinia striiformis f. sp. tritici]KAI7964546.1 hypothetical protein MJO29_002644 [Puccinia striiformis f.
MQQTIIPKILLVFFFLHSGAIITSPTPSTTPNDVNDCHEPCYLAWPDGTTMCCGKPVSLWYGFSLLYPTTDASCWKTCVQMDTQKKIRLSLEYQLAERQRESENFLRLRVPPTFFQSIRLALLKINTSHATDPRSYEKKT